MRSRQYIAISLGVFFLLVVAPNVSAQVVSDSVTAKIVDGDLVLETSPVDIPAPMAMADGDHMHSAVFPPIVHATLPVDGYIFGVEYELVDAANRPVPRRLLHHFNLLDPERREMFLPISRRLFAAGQETGSYKMPKTLLGIPFRAGDPVILSAMLHNPTLQSYVGVRLKLRIQFVKTGLPWPLAKAIPFQMDTQFPTGDKSFDLPPGKSSRSWQGQPVTEGRIIALGGHVHEFASRILLVDVSSGDTLWTGKPQYTETGELEQVSRGEFYGAYGILLEEGRTYQVTAEYHNTTDATIPLGGMGVIGGIIVPSDPEFNFSSNPSDSLYRADLSHFLRESGPLN